MGILIAPVPIETKFAEVHVHADPRLAFQVMTAFGASAQHAGGASSQILEKSEDGKCLLIEFHTPAKNLLGRSKVYRTVERVTLHEPEVIDFKGIEGMFPLLRDRITLLDDEAGHTRLRYESTFGLWGGILGQIFGRLVVRPKLEKFMREHVNEMKETIETRASRSRVYPQTPCTTLGVEEDDGPAA